MQNLQTILNQIATDQAFREALVNDPAMALQEVGIEPTDQLVATFTGLDLEKLGATVSHLC